MERFRYLADGENPERDAWIANFFTENHLAYEAFPHKVASPEQLKFVVFLDKQPYYYPCTQELFEKIVDKKGAETLALEYLKVWERLEPLVTSVIESPYRRDFLLSLLKIKFRHETASYVLLPSRLEKRLLQIFTRVSEIDRPLSKMKEAQNSRMAAILRSEAFHEALNDPAGIEASSLASLDKLAVDIRLLQLKRLISLSSHSELWANGAPSALKKDGLLSMMRYKPAGTGWQWLVDTIKGWLSSGQRRYVLWMGVHSGELILDLAMIRILISLGIKVIIAVKKAFYYNAVTIADMLEDPFIQEAIGKAEIITSPAISKKDLLGKLQSDTMLFIIHDGTQERFNPLLVSITFSRVFKEVDAIVLRSKTDAHCILQGPFQFTRDILAIYADGDGAVTLIEKPRHKLAVRFSETDLRTKADTLIYHMRTQKQRGKTIVFYSAIVGSIPHQMETAKEILRVFVNYLRKKQENVLVINPAEHFEPGMDADDLMYMWEIVQRSGLIDIWRFQTVEDIEKAFELMKRKVPPEWVGKDATYSTGCTKEMQIALDVQKSHPEMQIIGPSWDKFLRRKEYGVGKLYDRVLGDDFAY
ncbi:ARMT1-like domain-containing protein [Dissulfurimicrobium hydrothermale]|uniref:hypothetical protein n=1 Tax=Dissulfurimicrobium hydrothermale TaxID=1750598 RepID=UPI001EDA61A7|nr:hypothetical protein [Dissulfurimicrobium hydrothermale]UKL13253.1 hypothetical protein LGS26_07125 [Dissulfurimicrobium hydrothermale]